MLVDDINAAKLGDEISMVDLILKFKPIIIKYGVKLGEDGEHDITEFFITLIKKIPIIANDGGIVNYINLSIRNYCFKKLFKIKRESIYLDDSDIGCFTYCENEYNNILVKHSLDCLTPLQREIIIGLFFNNISEVEIAKKKNVSRQSIHNTKVRAIKLLREWLV